MSPERLKGGVLKKSGDIYSFGMTVFEVCRTAPRRMNCEVLITLKIYTGEIPLGNVSPSDLRQLVVDEDLRPEKPDEDEAPYMTDEIWDFAVRCWVKHPRQRPTATAVHDTISEMRQGAVSLPRNLRTLALENDSPYETAPPAVSTPLLSPEDHVQSPFLGQNQSSQTVPSSSESHPSRSFSKLLFGRKDGPNGSEKAS